MDRFKDKLRHWMESDLVGIPVTLAAAAIVAVAIGAFYFAGPLGGLAFAVLGIALVVVVAAQPGRQQRP